MRTNYWQDRLVMVTGASGFKGAYLCYMLAALGASVVALVRRGASAPSKSAYQLLDVSNRSHAVEEVDIRDREALHRTLAKYGPTDVFHLAAMAQVSVCQAYFLDAVATNVLGTLNLLDACRDVNVQRGGGRGVIQRLLVCSTDHVFGPQPDQVPTPEYHPVTWGGAYDSSKATMEMLVRSVYAEHSEHLPRLAVTRCANVVGPGDANPRRVLPAFLQAAASNSELPVLCTETRRQFIHVMDACAGYLRTLELLDKLPSGVTNVTPPTFHFGMSGCEYDMPGVSSDCISIGELAKFVATEFGGTLPAATAIPDHLPYENDLQSLGTEATRAALSWSPTISLRQATRDLFNWYTFDQSIHDAIPPVRWVLDDTRST